MVPTLKSSENVVELLHQSLFEMLRKLEQRHIYFDKSGVGRLCSILGYIAGMRDGGNVDFANRLTSELQSVLASLTPDDNTTTVDLVLPLDDAEVTIPVNVPAKKVLLSDDRTLHGFSMCAYSPVAPRRFDAELSRQIPIAEAEFTAEKAKHSSRMQVKAEAGVARISAKIEANWDGNSQNICRLLTTEIRREMRTLMTELRHDPQPLDFVTPAAKQAVWRQFYVPEPTAEHGVIGEIRSSEVYGFISDEQVAQQKALARFRRTTAVVYYGYIFHGGVIYHGPGAGQTFTVSLDSKRLWGIHT